MKRVETSLPRPRILIPAVVLLAVIGCGVAIARAEEKGPKVLTVEKLGGPEAVVGDEVAARLETGRSVQFVKSNGEVTCTTSEMKGKITGNPESGIANGTFEVATFTFAGCSSTIGGAGGIVKKVAITNFPLSAETQGSRNLNIAGNGNELRLEIAVETPAKEEISCVFAAIPLAAKYENNNGEIQIIQTSYGGFQNVMNCEGCNAGRPNWKAKYRPLQDETGERKGKQIYIN